MSSHRVLLFLTIVVLQSFALLIPLSCSAKAQDLSTAPPDELMRVYKELRALHTGEQWAVAENIEWKRDAATFKFRNGRLSFAAPVVGHVLAAYFEGQGSVEIVPPTPTDRAQIARFTKSPKLEDSFRSAVFFFTDDSWSELQQLVNVHESGGNPAKSTAIASAMKRYSESFNDWWENETKDNPQMRNLAARMLADLSDPGSRGFFLADFKGEHAGDLLYHISWNRDPLLLPFFASDEEVMLLHYNRNSYFEWLSGFHAGGEYANSPHPEHRARLAHCREERIEAEVSKDNHLSATANMEFEVQGGPARLLPLNLRGVLRIDSVKDAQGKDAAFIQEDRKLDNDPWLVIPESAKPGTTYKLTIAYTEDSTRDSRIIHQLGSGLYYVTARESWFPNFGAFDDRSRYSLRFSSPRKFTLVATGRKVKAKKEKDSYESEWESEIPYGVVGFNYGDFVDKSQSGEGLTVTAYSGKEVPDELKGVQSAIDMAEFGAGPNGPKNIAGQVGIATGGFNTASQAAYAAGVSYQAMKLFEFYFGQLPFKSISVTEQPIRGYGQSWPTLIFLPYDSLLDSTTRQGLRLQDTAEAREFYKIVAIHEMAHQWWGHLVGYKTYHDQWLSEGFAEFSAALYLRQFDPKSVKGFWDLKRTELLHNNSGGHRPVDVGPLWLNYQLNSYLEPRNSFDLVYLKGAYVLEMLRLLMEDSKAQNPDAGFIGMMRDFTSTYAGKNASTEDFRRIVEKHTGLVMDWFFNEWVYGTEIPQYDFSYQLKDGGGGKSTLQVSLVQSGVSDSFEMRVPMYTTMKGQTRRLGFLKIKGPTTFKAEIPLPFRPEKVTLDEYHSILCTVRQ